MTKQITEKVTILNSQPSNGIEPAQTSSVAWSSSFLLHPLLQLLDMHLPRVIQEKSSHPSTLKDIFAEEFYKDQALLK